MLIRKIQEHLLRQHLVIGGRQGIQVIFIDPGEADLLPDPLFIPGEAGSRAQIALDQQTAHRRQDLFLRIFLIKGRQEPVVKPVEKFRPGGQGRGPQGQRLSYHAMGHTVIQGMDLKGFHIHQKGRILFQKPAGLNIQEGTVASVPVLGLEAVKQRRALLKQLRLHL